MCTCGGLTLISDIFVDCSPQYILNFIISFGCVCTFSRTHGAAQIVEVRKQLCGVGSVCPPSHGFQGSNSGCQAYMQAPFPAEPLLALHSFPEARFLSENRNSQYLTGLVSLSPGSLASFFWVLVSQMAGLPCLPDFYMGSEYPDCHSQADGVSSITPEPPSPPLTFILNVINYSWCLSILVSPYWLLCMIAISHIWLLKWPLKSSSLVWVSTVEVLC